MKNMREFFESTGLDIGACELRTKGLAFTPTIDRENRLVKGLVSTAGMDLDGEIVLQDFDTAYFPDQVRAVYLDHVYTRPEGVAAVGVCRNLTQRKDGLYATTFVLPGPVGDQILDAMEAGALTGFSIGFQVTDGGPATPDEMQTHNVGEGTFVIRKSKLLEYSFTSMPANGEALAKRFPVLNKALRQTVEKKSRELVVVGDVVMSRNAG